MSIRTKWILTLSVLVILLVGIAVYYSRQQDRHDKLADNLDKVQNTLITNSQRKAILQGQLDLANLAYTDGLAVFPDSSQSMEIQQALLGAADEAGVVVASISTGEPKVEQVAGRSYQVFSVQVSAQGRMEDVLRFVGVLGYWLPTSAIDSTGVTMNEGGQAALTMSLQVYASQTG
jgi:Tfp pilus assembly protein PilO